MLTHGNMVLIWFEIEIKYEFVNQLNIYSYHFNKYKNKRTILRYNLTKCITTKILFVDWVEKNVKFSTFTVISQKSVNI